MDRWIGGVIIKIWQSWVKLPDLMEHLTVDAKTILGIVGSCGEISSALISEVMFPKEWCNDEMAKNAREIDKLRKKLKLSRHTLVQQALQYGLPLSAATPLFLKRRRLRCKYCRNPLSSVPCAVCACRRMVVRGGLTLPELEVAGDWADRPQDKPTSFAPGSREKKIVMKYRQQRGFNVFCVSDA